MKKFAILFVAVLFTALNLFADETTPSTAGTGTGTLELNVIYPVIVMTDQDDDGETLDIQPGETKLLNTGGTAGLGDMKWEFTGAKGVTFTIIGDWEDKLETDNYFEIKFPTLTRSSTEFDDNDGTVTVEYKFGVFCKPGTPRAEYNYIYTVTLDY